MATKPRLGSSNEDAPSFFTTRLNYSFPHGVPSDLTGGVSIPTKWIGRSKVRLCVVCGEPQYFHARKYCFKHRHSGHSLGGRPATDWAGLHGEAFFAKFDEAFGLFNLELFQLAKAASSGGLVQQEVKSCAT